MNFLCQIAKLPNRWHPCFHCVIVPFRTMKSSFVKSHRVYCIYIHVVSSLNYLIEFLLFGVRHLWHSPFFFIKRLSICAEQHLSNKRCWQHCTTLDLLNFDSNWLEAAWKQTVEADWKKIGSRQEWKHQAQSWIYSILTIIDWKQTGSRLEADWKQTGSRLKADRKQ